MKNNKSTNTVFGKIKTIALPSSLQVSLGLALCRVYKLEATT